MSRIGRKPIAIPSGVKVNIADNCVLVEGPKGKLETRLPRGIEAEVADGWLLAKRKRETKEVRALHGLARALMANAVHGVSKGFSKELDVVGIGFRAEVRGSYLNLSLGFSHPIEFPIPAGIQVGVERLQRPISNYVTTIRISGADKRQVGQVAAEVRELRLPDAYKGKGIRYSDEVVRTKVGKKGA